MRHPYTGSKYGSYSCWPSMAHPPLHALNPRPTLAISAVLASSSLLSFWFSRPSRSTSFWSLSSSALLGPPVPLQGMCVSYDRIQVTTAASSSTTGSGIRFLRLHHQLVCNSVGLLTQEWAVSVVMGVRQWV
jgi:hypothetical protein